jgi:hypothetical protein
MRVLDERGGRCRHNVTVVAARLPGGREGHQTIKRTVETRCQYGGAVGVFGCHTGQVPWLKVWHSRSRA